MPSSKSQTREERIDAVAEMRARMLGLKLADLRLGSLPQGRRLLAALMETGIEDAAFSLVTVVDGTVSLYFSNGGGTIGAGMHEPVRTAAAEFLDSAEHFAEMAEPTDESPLPEDGRVTFYFVTKEGLLTYSAVEVELGEERDEFAPLFFAAHSVISEIRAVEEKRSAGQRDA